MVISFKGSAFGGISQRNDFSGNNTENTLFFLGANLSHRIRISFSDNPKIYLSLRPESRKGLPESELKPGPQAADSVVYENFPSNFRWQQHTDPREAEGPPARVRFHRKVKCREIIPH